MPAIRPAAVGALAVVFIGGCSTGAVVPSGSASAGSPSTATSSPTPSPTAPTVPSVVPAAPTGSVAATPDPAATIAEGNDLLDRAADVLRNQYRSFHVGGGMVRQGYHVTYDIAYVGGNSSGSIGVAGGTSELRVVGSRYYFRADAKVWEFLSPGNGERVAGLLGTRWVAGKTSSARFDIFRDFATRTGVLAGIDSLHGAITAIGAATVKGIACRKLSSPDGMTLYVARDDGRLIRVARAALEARMDFTYRDYPKPTAPPDADVVPETGS